MVDHQVLLPDGGEGVAAVIADALGIARIVRHEFEIGALDPGELRQIVERKHAVDQEDFVVGDRQRALHEAAQLGRHHRVELQPDHRAAPPLLKRGFERAHQVFGFFLDFHFRVADDAEGALPFDGVAGEQQPDEQRRCLLERDEADIMIAAARQPDEALDLLRHADERVHRLAVAHTRELQRDGEAKIGNERERMRRIDRERREQREHVGEEVILQPVLVGLLHLGAANQGDAGSGEFRPQFDPALLLVPAKPRHRFADAEQLLVGGEPVGALGHDALAHLALEAGDAHHEEFIKVVGGNRQEAHPLQQRMVLVGSLLQHPAIEVQPGQLAVDEAVRARPQIRLNDRIQACGHRFSVADRSDFLNIRKRLSAICHWQ